jgi:hypothetical protein
MEHERWPALPLAAWEPTFLTLHRWTQIAGKLRLALEPHLNHWWQVALYVSPRGLTTGAMPYPRGMVAVTFDLYAHRLRIDTSERTAAGFALEPMSVATFYARFGEALRELGIAAPMWPVPVEVSDRTPFPDDHHHASYDPPWATRLHRVLMAVDPVFRTHRGRYAGKASPVHLFWGGFDLAVTRFSGRRNPAPPPDRVQAEAYSHEVISHGFWPGGNFLDKGRVEEPVFYAYAVPEPVGFRSARVVPSAARYSEQFGEYLLPYEAVRTARDPEATLLDFMDATFFAAALPARWDLSALGESRPPRQELFAPS